MQQNEYRVPDAAAMEQARKALERAGGGDTTGANVLDQAAKADPVAADAAEQEAADGPAGRGLSR